MPSAGISESIAAISASAASAGAATAATGATAATAGTAAGASASAIAASTAAAAAGGIETASIPLASAAAGAASTVPAWAGTASLGLSALGGVTGAIGAIQAGNAKAASDKYNASVATINANQALTNATLTGESGAAQSAIQERKTRAEVGSIKANQAASGLNVNSGSALDVRSSASELGELDALTVRSNAAREAYGYQTQSTSFTEQAGLDTTAAKNDSEAGEIGAASTVLGSAGAAGSNYLRFLQAGSFS